MSEQKGRLERMMERLNSRTRYKEPLDSREPITQTDTGSAPEGWESPNIDELLMADRRKPEPYPLMKKIFLVAVLFFTCAAAAAALIYFKGDNFISTKNLDIEIEAPVSISAGSPIDLEVTITNKNNAPLSAVNMTIIYPEGTRNADDATKPLLSSKESLEALGAGEKIVRNERAIFLGSEGEVKNVRVSVTYKVEGSNATFTKDKVFELTIGSAPVTVSITRPESVTSGEPFSMTINVVSNSEEVLRGVILRAEYPYGWSSSSASPEAYDRDNSAWILGDLSPGGKKTITLRGAILGEDNDERTFRFFVGVGEGGGATFDTALSSNSMVVSIRRPSVDLGLRLNGDTSAEYTAIAGKQIQGVVTFRNNMPDNIQNPQLEVRLSGAALDRGTVAAQMGGFYNSANGSIFWNSSNYDEMRTLAPGDSHSVSFSFSSLTNLPPGTSNQKIEVAATLTGRPQNASSQVTVSEKRTVKVASEVALSSRSLYSRGPFSNTGPIPPKAESETTYTIALTLGNTQNDVNDAKVTGVLGPNVKWLSTTSSDGGVVYDANTRTVTWNAGTLPSGAGFSEPAKEVFFKVGLTPSLGQVGGAPVLLGNISFTGTDAFTQSIVRLTNPSVTTRISTDPRYVSGDEIVVK